MTTSCIIHTINGDHNRRRQTRLSARSFAAGLFALAALSTSAHAQGSVTIASWGGGYQKGEVESQFKPAAAALGATIREDTLTGLADVRVQVKAGKVNWDIVDLSSGECAIGAKEGLFEPIDYSVVPIDGIPENARSKYFVGSMFYSYVIAWNTKKYGQNPPKNWADFWDLKKYPGNRSLYGTPRQTFEAALIGDGVPRDKVYPIDIKRAVASLEKIKPSIQAWWKSGAQSTQLLRDGEVDLIGIWASRAIALKNDGLPVDFTFNDGILDFVCLAIPKGAPNRELAMKVLGKVLSPEIQANIPSYLDYSPINQKAFDTGRISPEKARQLNASPENAKKQLLMQPNWWGENSAQALEALTNSVLR